jgi:hypothetical protein
MSACVHAAHRYSWLVVTLLVLVWRLAPVAACVDIPRQSAPDPVGAPAWPCRLVVVGDLRPSVEVAWAQSPTFRSQCERLAAAGTIVLLHRASAVQTPRQAESMIGVSAEGVTVARVLVRVNVDTVELIAHELEHVLEHLEGVNFGQAANRHRSGVTVDGHAYESARAIKAGQRVAREVRESLRAAR